MEEEWPQEVNSPFTGGPAQLSWESIEIPYRYNFYLVKRYYYHDQITGDNFQSPEQFDAVIHQLRTAHTNNTTI